MDERIRLWREIGLRFVLRPPLAARGQSGLTTANDAPCAPAPAPPSTQLPKHSCPDELLFYHRRLKSPMAAIIAYPSLDQDFRGHPNDARMRLLHAIIENATPWNHEEVAFWPPAVHGPAPVSTETLERHLFQIIAEFSPKYILDFGGCVESFFTNQTPYPRHRPPQTSMPKHILLPNLDDMLPDNKVVKKAAWDTLRGLTP